MNAISKANFINSVAGGNSKICPSCNAVNDLESRFCETCGAKLEDMAVAPIPEVEEAQAVVPMPELKETQVVEPILEEEEPEAVAPMPEMESKPNAIPVMELKKVNTEYQELINESVSTPVSPKIAERIEQLSAFASGLPDWNIVPPQIMVRRKKAR